MAEIKQYTRQIMPRETVAMQNVSGAFGGGEGAMALGKAAGEVSDKLKEIQLKRDEAAYLSKKTNFELDLMKMQQDLSTQEIDGDIGLAYQQAYNQRAAEFEASIPDSMQGQWQLDNSNFVKSFTRAGLEDQITREGLRRELEWNNAIDNYNEMVKRNPAAKDTAVANLQKLANTYNLSPEARALMMDKASDDLAKVQQSANRAAFVSGIEADPLGFLEDAKANPNKYKREDVEMARKLALDFVDRAEQDVIIEDIARSQDFATKLGRGELSMTDVEAEVALNGETTLTKQARKMLLEDKPKRTDLEKSQAYSNLENRRLIIEKDLEENGVTQNNMSRLRSLSDDAIQAAIDGLLEESEITRFTRNSNILLESVQNNKGSKEFWKMNGYQNPYSYGYKNVNDYMKDNDIDDALMKTEILKRFDVQIQDYKSTGDKKKDATKLREAVTNARAQYFMDLKPEYSTIEDIPAVININGVDINTGFEGGKKKRDVVAAENVVEMQDADGNRALVRVDENGNIIEVVKELQ